MVKIVLMISAILVLWSSNAAAQQRLAVGHCVADLRKLCPGIPPGNNNLRACLREHIRDVSFPCLVTLAKFAEVRRSLKECSAHLQQQCANVEVHAHQMMDVRAGHADPGEHLGKIGGAIGGQSELGMARQCRHRVPCPPGRQSASAPAPSRGRRRRTPAAARARKPRGTRDRIRA